MKTTVFSETSASNYKTTRFKNQEKHKMGIPYVGSLKYPFSRRILLVRISPLSLSLVSVQSRVLPLPPFAAVSVRFGARIGCTIDFPPNTSGFSFQYRSTIAPYKHSIIYHRQYIVFVTKSVTKFTTTSTTTTTTTVCFVFLVLQTIVFVFSQPGGGL
jgi:hypothetical protein